VRVCSCCGAHGSYYRVTGCSDEVPLVPRVTPLILSHARENESMSSSVIQVRLQGKRACDTRFTRTRLKRQIQVAQQGALHTLISQSVNQV
jgi:hypothetical protein